MISEGKRAFHRQTSLEEKEVEPRPKTPSLTHQHQRKQTSCRKQPQGTALVSARREGCLVVPLTPWLTPWPCTGLEEKEGEDDKDNRGV